MHPKILPTVRDFSGTGGSLRTGLVLLLATALLGTSAVTAFAQTAPSPDPATVANEVKNWGIGKDVKMTLVSGEQLEGHIRAINADSFTIKVGKAHTERAIPYSQVTFIKDPGPLTWILVGAAIVIVIIIVAAHH